MRNLLFFLFVMVLISQILIGCNDEDQEKQKVTGYKKYIMTVVSQKLKGVVGVGFHILSEM